jgi:hypothetical protein
MREIGGRYGGHDTGRIADHHCVGPSGHRECSHENGARQYCPQNMIEHEFLLIAPVSQPWRKYLLSRADNPTDADSYHSPSRAHRIARRQETIGIASLFAAREAAPVMGFGCRLDPVVLVPEGDARVGGNKPAGMMTPCLHDGYSRIGRNAGRRNAAAPRRR